MGDIDGTRGYWGCWQVIGIKAARVRAHKYSTFGQGRGWGMRARKTRMPAIATGKKFFRQRQRLRSELVPPPTPSPPLTGQASMSVSVFGHIRQQRPCIWLHSALPPCLFLSPPPTPIPPLTRQACMGVSVWRRPITPLHFTLLPPPTLSPPPPSQACPHPSLPALHFYLQAVQDNAPSPPPPSNPVSPSHPNSPSHQTRLHERQSLGSD